MDESSETRDELWRSPQPALLPMPLSNYCCPWDEHLHSRLGVPLLAKQGWRFSRLTFFPFTHPALTRSGFYQVLKHLDLFCWLEKVALVHIRTKGKNTWLNQIPLSWGVIAFANPSLEFWETQTMPRKMLLSHHMSFLLQKEHALLHIVLRKGKN